MSNSAPIQTANTSMSGDFTTADEPLRLFSSWFEEAKRAEPQDANAMTLATVDADAYFATRPRLAQIGAWASRQSAPLESRLAFEKAVALYTAKHLVGTVPRPPHWSGYRVVPLKIEFWQDRPFRLHDRVEFRLSGPGEVWTKTRMYP